MRSAALIVSCLLLASALEGRQQSAPTIVAGTQAFEVTSIRQSLSSDTQMSLIITPQGTLTAVNAPLRALIVQGLHINPLFEKHVLIGGPDRILSARFDVLGKPPREVSREAGVVMLRTLLKERFGLRTHTETRQIPVYALTLMREGRLGPRLQRSRFNCRVYIASRGGQLPLEEPRRGDELLCAANPFQPEGMRIVGAGEIADLIPALNFGSALDRPVIDKSGLTGNFEWQLTFAPPYMRSSQEPSIFTAVSEQLGLKLEPRVVSMEVNVIDSVAMPTPN